MSHEEVLAIINCPQCYEAGEEQQLVIGITQDRKFLMLGCQNHGEEINSLGRFAVTLTPEQEALTNGKCPGCGLPLNDPNHVH